MIYDYKLFGLTELDDTIDKSYDLFDKINIINKVYDFAYPKSFTNNTKKYIASLEKERYNLLLRLRTLFMIELHNKGFNELNNDSLEYFKNALNWIIKHYSFKDQYFFDVAKNNCIYEIKNEIINKLTKYVNSKAVNYLSSMRYKTFTLKKDKFDNVIATFKRFKVLLPESLAKDYVKYILNYTKKVNLKAHPVYCEVSTIENDLVIDSNLFYIDDNLDKNEINSYYIIIYSDKLFNIINKEISRLNEQLSKNSNIQIKETEVILPRKV